MLKYLFCFFIFFVSIQNLFAQDKVKLDYDVKYRIFHDVSNSERPKLNITCLFNTDILNLKKSNKTSYFYIYLPDQWSAAHNLHHYIHDLRALEQHTQIINLKEPDRKKIIINPADKFISLNYDVYPKEEIDILEPIINKDIFHFIGYTLLITPDLNSNKNLKIKFELTSSLNENNKNITFSSSYGPHMTQIVSMNLNKFLHSAFAGGAYQVNHLSTDNTTVLSYNLESENKKYILDTLNKIIPIQKTFWNEPKNKNNILFIHADDHVRSTLSGTHTNNDTISVLINKRSPFLTEDLPEFLAHENWHHWMGEKFYSAHSYKHMAWLFEGITDYYAHKTTYQAGILDAAGWVKKYNRILAKHYLSPVRNKANQAIIKYFDEDPSYTDLPYTRGKIIGLELDNRIQKLSNNQYSLDDVLKDLCAENKSRAVTIKAFQTSLQKFYPDAKNFIKLYIAQGKDLPLSVDILKKQAYLKLEKIKPESYGLDLNATFTHKIISGLLEHTTAYQQGLRNGQVVLSHEVNYKDINKPISLKVLSENNIEQVFILERIGTPILVPQYEHF